MPAPELYLPIEAQGSLRLDAPSGRTVALTANRDTLTLEVPTWSELKGLSPRSWSARLMNLRRLSALLSTCALTLRMQTRGQTFLEIGANVRPNVFAKLAGLSSVRPTASLLRLLLRR